MSDNTGLSASDVLALVGNKDNGIFGNGSIGIFALIIIFILLFRGRNVKKQAWKKFLKKI